MFGTLKSKIGGIFKKSSDSLFSTLSTLPISKFKKHWSGADFLGAYEISLYANKAINKRAEKVGEIQFELTKGDNPIEKHEILDLLSKPNESFTGSEFWSLYQKYFDIYGEVYILLDAEPRMGGKTRVNEMHLLNPPQVKPFFNKQTGEVSKVEYNTAEGTATYTGDQIIYSHNPSPNNPLRGESLLKAGISQIQTGANIDEYHSKILENGGRVEGVFNFKADNLGREQLKEIKDSYQEEYGKASKAGLPLFLSGNANYERLGLDPAELAYLETKNVNLNDISILTGTPKTVLGMTSEETFANADAAIRVFLKETIRPLLKSLTTKLDEVLVPEDLTLTFIDPTPENKEDIRQDLETANNLHALTINEKREALGYEPIKNGDEILVPMNLVPISREVQTNPEKSIKTKKVHHPLRDLETRKIYHALQLKRLDRRQEKMLDVMQKYFKGQKQRIVESIDVKKQFKKKDLISEVFNTTLEMKLAKESVLPVLEQLLREAGEDSKEISGSDFDFDMSADITSSLDKRVDVFSETINNTTFKKLQSEFQQSLDAGETRKELVDRIEKTYEEKITTARAATIARTEIHWATQLGTLEGYKQAGVPIKIYVHAPGTQGGIRDSHQSMDGQEVPTDGYFQYPSGARAKFPGSTGIAAEDINCACFI